MLGESIQAGEPLASGALADGGPAYLFFDIDGTLIWHDPDLEVSETVAKARPSDAVYQAFRTLALRGHRTFICTGRPLCMVPDPLLELNPTGIICSGGACLYLDERIARDKAMPHELLIRSVELISSCNADVMFEGTHNSVMLAARDSVADPIYPAPRAVDAAGMERVTDMRFNKICIPQPELEKLGPVRDELDAFFDLFDLGGGAFEMTQRGVDKGYGVRGVLDHYGVGAETAFAFGDSGNDLPMSSAVDTFVAMGNALEPVKEVASFVTDSVQNDGVVRALLRLGLI